MPPRRKREDTNMEDENNFELHIPVEEKDVKADNEDSNAWGGDDFSLRLSLEGSLQADNKETVNETFIVSKKSNETEKDELPSTNDGETNKNKTSAEKQSEAKVVKGVRKMAKKATGKQEVPEGDGNLANVEIAESQEKPTKPSRKKGSNYQNKSDIKPSDDQPDMTEKKSNATRKTRGKRGGDKESKTPEKIEQRTLRRRNVTGTKEKEEPATTKQSDDDLKEPVAKKKKPKGKGEVASKIPIVKGPSTAQRRRGHSPNVQQAVPAKQTAKSKKTRVHVEHCTS